MLKLPIHTIKQLWILLEKPFMELHQWLRDVGRKEVLRCHDAIQIRRPSQMRKIDKKPLIIAIK
jgi:hypothetical protein